MSSGQLKRASDRLRSTDQVLYYAERFVVPLTLRQETLRLVHSQHHFGQAGTLRSLRNTFFWPRMARDAKGFCRGCLTCQKAKHKSSGRAPMEQMTIGRGIPGEAVAMDVGVLPWTDDPVNGYGYFHLCWTCSHGMWKFNHCATKKQTRYSTPSSRVGCTEDTGCRR